MAIPFFAKSSRISVWLSFAMVVIVGMLPMGCEVDSFLDPSQTGYFERTPTSMPILNRIDIIERELGYQPDITKPTSDDLVPNELKYRLAPGDVVRVEIYELVVANQTDVSVRVIDQSGVIRLPTLGDVEAAGLTVDELQAEIINKLKGLITDPLVTVVLEEGRSFQFTIYGAVSGTGIYALTRPDFRIMDALSLAGGTAATTRRILVIREVALDESVKASYLRGTEPDGSSNDKSGGKKPVDIDALIDQLGDDEPPSPAARGSSDDPPVDVDDLTSNKPVKSNSQTTSPPSRPKTPAPGFVFDQQTQKWVRVEGNTDAAANPAMDRLRAGMDAANADDNEQRADSPYATRIIEIDYQSLARGDSLLNIVVRPGDRIFADTPEVGVVYVDGNVSRPGVYQLPIAGKLTLSRLIAAAGGLNPIAVPERVDLIRKIAEDRESALRVNLAAIRNRAEPDIYMRRDDHVIVGTNFWASPLAVVRNGFRMTYGFGFLLDRNFGNDVFGAPPTNFVN